LVQLGRVVVKISGSLMSSGGPQVRGFDSRHTPSLRSRRSIANPSVVEVRPKRHPIDSRFIVITPLPLTRRAD
jgi:hypothetical protein